MANMSTAKPKDVLDEALKSIPSNFRKHILKTYRDLKTRHSEAKYDASGLSAGKFCFARGVALREGSVRAYVRNCFDDDRPAGETSVNGAPGGNLWRGTFAPMRGLTRMALS
jgi:hypothetical protein